MPLVSVLMNCYNCEKYLKKAVKSIINQTYTNWELIFMDNCSIDKSFIILNSFNDKRIKYFKTKNHCNLGKARKIAWNKCQGEYVAFLDSDDISFSKRLETQINYFKNNNEVAVLGSGIEIINENDNIIDIDLCPVDPTILKKLLFICFPFMNSTLMINKKKGDECGGIQDNYDIVHDHAFIFQISKKYKVANSNIIFSQWRKHENNLSWNSMLKGQNELKSLLQLMTKDIDKKDQYLIKQHKKTKALNFLKISFLNLKKFKIILFIYYLIKSIFLSPFAILNNNKFKNFFGLSVSKYINFSKIE